MQSNGVSTLVGFILLLLIGMVFLSVVQTQVIPGILKDVEIKHMDEITDDLLKLSSNLLACKLSTVEFDLGVKYPKYLFLLTPQSLASSIYCEDENISLKANLSYPIESKYNLNDVTGINKTKRIIIHVNNFAQPDYYLVYENSAIFKFTWKLEGSKPVIVSDQKMFIGNVLNVFLINGSMFNSISTTGTVDVAVIPISVGKAYVKNLLFEFESIYPDYWNKTLHQQGFKKVNAAELSNYNKAYNISGKIIRVYLKNATLNIYYCAILSGIGVSQSGYNLIKPRPWKMVKTTYQGIDPINITVGQSIKLGIRLIDPFLSPVVGEKVVITSNGNVNPSVTYTDTNGEAYTIFWAENEGNYYAKFSSNSTNNSIYAIYNISVVTSVPPSSGSGSGGSTGNNISIELSCPEGWYTDSYAQKTIIARVTANGQPLPGCNVVFSTNSSDVLVKPSSTTTNESGYAVTTISQRVLGKHLYRVYVYALGAYASHDILLNSTVPLDVHVLKVYIKNLMNIPLENYQVRVEIAKSLLNGIKPDGRDLRVAKSLIDPYNQTQGKLPFWIEIPPSHGKLVFWVRVNLSAMENKTIFVYWSGRNVNSESDGNAVFDFFDDFNGNKLNKSRWRIYSTGYRVSNSVLTIYRGGIELKNPLPFRFQDGYIAETKVKFNSFWAYYYSGVIPEVASSPYTASGNRNKDATILYMIGSRWFNRLVKYWIGDGSIPRYNIASGKSTGWRASANVWYITGISVYDGTVKLWKDGNVLRVESGINWAKDLKYVKLGSFHRDKWYDIKDTSYDWIRVRKYVEPEPKVTIGNPIQ